MSKPMVFVSSTIKDMRTARSIIKKLFVDDYHYDVIISEDEGSKVRSSLAQCKKWARDCDIFIAVMGENYGFIPKKLGISVSEMEFTEAYKSNPEKILVYISAGKKDGKQSQFIKRVGDFNDGYFRRKPFINEPELIDGIKIDLAEFMKDRLDTIKQQKFKIKPITTPKETDYITSIASDRLDRMHDDARDALHTLGFLLEQDFEIRYGSFKTSIYRKKINRLNVLFTISISPDNLDTRYLRSYNMFYQDEIKYKEAYKANLNRFTIHLLSGKGSFKSMESIYRMLGGLTSFKIDCGFYCGVGLHKPRSNKYGSFIENTIFLTDIQNKQSLFTKLTEALAWIQKEYKNIDFKCTYTKPIKLRIKKFRPSKHY